MSSATEIIEWTYVDRIRTNRDRRLLDEFFALYRASFPDDSEREEITQWERALRGDTAYEFAFLAARSPSRIAGGIVLEFYPVSRCGLLTFVFVHPLDRCRGIARELILRACERLRERGARQVFAEAEDPVKVEAAGVKTSIDPRLRLRILHRLGARRIDIRYVQPPLGPNKRAAEHLMLLVFGEDEAVDRALLTAFLVEFYGVLGLDNTQIEQLIGLAFTGICDESIPLIPLA